MINQDKAKNSRSKINKMPVVIIKLITKNKTECTEFLDVIIKKLLNIIKMKNIVIIISYITLKYII